MFATAINTPDSHLGVLPQQPRATEPVHPGAINPDLKKIKRSLSLRWRPACSVSVWKPRIQKGVIQMENVTVTKGSGPDKKALPVFANLDKRFEEIQRRAFEFFEQRGSTIGNELEDWLKAEHEILGWPKAQLAEKKDAFEIRLTLPGFEAKDVDVTATPGELIVHAAAETEKKSEEGQVLWTEFGSNELYRRLEFPGTVDVGKITATLDKGVLRIKAPKGAAVPAKAVPAKKVVTVAAA